MRSCTLLFSAALVLFGVSALCAEVHHVPGDYYVIQEAIDAAVDGDTVLVADGTYTGEGNRNIDFLGKAVLVTSENGPDSTIIDCEMDGNRGFIFHSGEDSTSILEGFTIQNGRGSYGGAIGIANASPTITGNVLKNNGEWRTTTEGGAIYCYNSGARIVGNTITNNECVDAGGGIFCENSWAVISGNVINDNNGINTGGGIALIGGGPVLIDNNMIELNRSMADNWGQGAGIHLVSTEAVITYNLIDWNQSDIGGAGMLCRNSSVFLEGNNIQENQIYTDNTADGGGVYIEGGDFVLRSNVISRNTLWQEGSGGRGGGVYVKNAVGALFGNTIVKNRIELLGSTGGLAVWGSESYVTVANCIIWNNDMSEIGHMHSTIVVEYSNVKGGHVGEGNMSSHPRFVDSSGGDFHLQDISPCIDAGDPGYVPSPKETDFDGEPRRMRGRVDMGADEFPQWPHHRDFTAE